MARGAIRFGSRPPPEWERVIGVLRDRLIRAGDEPGVISPIRCDPDTGLSERVVETPLNLEILIVVNQKRSAGDCVERPGVQEQAPG